MSVQNLHYRELLGRTQTLFPDTKKLLRYGTHVLQAPQADGLVVRSRREKLPVSGPSHVRDTFGMTLKRFDDITRLRVPQFDKFIRSLLAVFCERAVHDE